MLEVSALRAGYGAIEVLRGVDLTVGAGEVVSMRFTTPGTLPGACDVSPGGEFTINVADQSA